MGGEKIPQKIMKRINCAASSDSCKQEVECSSTKGSINFFVKEEL